MIAFPAEYPAVDPDFDLDIDLSLIAEDEEELQMLRDLEELFS